MPLLQPVAGLFLAGQLDPSIAAGSDVLQAILGYRDLSRLCLDPGHPSFVPGPLVREYDLRRQDLVGFSGSALFKQLFEVLWACGRFQG